jgi:phospholipid-binding lipoprotein MlaA
LRRPKSGWASRLGVAGLAFLAIALTGCGTVSRTLTAASADAPRVAVRSAVTPEDLAQYLPYALAAGASVDVALASVAAPVPVDPAVAAIAAETDLVGFEADAQDGGDAGIQLAQARQPRGDKGDKDEYEVEEYDPWEPFNERMFTFNLKLDRYVLKPVAKVWDKVVPDEIQRMLANGFDNLEAIRRMVNSLLQMKWDGAVRELSRFMLNTTMGIGGLFDMSKAAGIEKSREDFGQTLGFYGAPPGPYLVLPFYAPSTVRDFIGRTVDGFLNPLRYILPGGSFFFDAFTDPAGYVNDTWIAIVVDAGEMVNERSLNLELFQGFEETVIDMYSAVRHAYLERRRNLIKE